MKKKPQAHQYFAFHQNEGLLFQFLLNECLSTLRTLQEKPNGGLLKKLIGDPSQTQPWSFQLGHLPKLRSYYSLFLKYFTDSQVILIESALSRADAIVKDPSFAEASPQAFRKSIQQLKCEIKQITSLLFEKLPDYQENECVLYFLLRSHEQLENVYGEPIIAKIFSTLFLGGIRQAGLFLEEQYARGGFTHLLPLINEKIDSLESSFKKWILKTSAA